MTDLSTTIDPKSNQTNADDLLSGPRTINITAVKASGEGEQPICIHFDGDKGKPYKPCKSMRRLMVTLWGANGSEYVGRQMTIYCDPKVKWGGIEVGGIRISHMSHIEKDTTVALTESKTKRTPTTVRKLVVSQHKVADAPPKSPGDITKAVAAIKNCTPETVDATKAALWKLHTWTDPEVQDLKKAVEEVKSTTKEVSGV